MKEKLEARLEIRVYPKQLKKLREEAKNKGTSIGNIIREAIDQRYQVSGEDKLKAVQKMAGINGPVSDWDQMKHEIETGMNKE